MDNSFKQLVNSTKPTLKRSSVKSLRYLYKHYKIKCDSSLSINELIRYLHNLIQDYLVGSDLYSAEIFSLRDQLLLTHFVNSENLQPYLGILEIIIDAIQATGSNSDQSIQKIVSFESRKNWIEAIKITRDIAVISPEKINSNLQCLQKRFKKQFIISEQAKILQAQGCNVKLQNGKVLIEESQIRNIVNSIESDIKLLGGISTLTILFNIIKPKYCEEQGRYHLSASFNSLIEMDFPKIPVGYLLNLCVKFPTKKIQLEVKTSSDIWNRIKQKSIALTSILDVQPYSQFSLFNHSSDTIIRFLQELALSDSLFCPPQLRSSDVSRILRGLFAWCSEDTEQKLGWTPDQAAIIVEKIFELTSGKPNLAIFRSAQIHDLIPEVSKEIIDALLIVFSHNENSVNSCFLLPRDIAITENYFQFKPLIKLEQDKYLLVNPSICSPAFYEAVVSELRKKVDKQINDKLGREGVEIFIQNEFLQHGIEFKCGEYQVSKGKCLEIDIVVETTDTLIFLEMKSKSLTRKSKDGNDLDLLVDLSKSLLESQIQLITHKLYIMQNETITLKGGYICKLNNRNIALVSISLLDFGSFQDRLFIQQFLNNMLFGEFDTSHNEIKQKVLALNEKISELKSLITKIGQLDPERPQDPFYNCWFLSVPQLLILLDNVNSNDNLKQELWRTRSVTTGSFDFYREYYNARQRIKKV